MANKTEKKEVTLNLDGMSDVDLQKKAVGLGITVTEDTKRENLEQAVIKAVLAKSEHDKEIKEEMDKKGLVCIQYTGKGTTKIDGKIWRGTMRSIVSEKEANILVCRFPKRFRINK